MVSGLIYASSLALVPGGKEYAEEVLEKVKLLGLLAAMVCQDARCSILVTQAFTWSLINL
jgi:hypothetical protein